MNHSGKKSWKGYLLDFVMLFLAVSLGFMADNFRERASERSKEIAKGLVQVYFTFCF